MDPSTLLLLGEGGGGGIVMVQGHSLFACNTAVIATVLVLNRCQSSIGIGNNKLFAMHRISIGISENSQTCIAGKTQIAKLPI